MIDCHVLPCEAGDGPANMALDEAMLDAVADGPPTAYLRTYFWSTPTLSLGYFQSLAEAQAIPRWTGVPIVRRLSGGGAIWHHHELTYALVVPVVHALVRPNTKLYRAVHGAILQVLGNRGVPARLRGDDFSMGDCERGRTFLCFKDTHADDILIQGEKIVGSAQRRRRGAVLQHGSLLLARSARTPELGGVCDEVDVTDEPIHWSGLFEERIPAVLGMRRVTALVPAELRARAGELEQERYGNPAWTALR